MRPALHPELRGHAWGLYITGSALSFVQIGFLTAWSAGGAAEAVGLVGAIATLVSGIGTSLASIVLFQIDAIRAFTELREARRDLRVEGHARVRPTFAVAPWVLPDGESAGLAAVAIW